MRQLAAALLLIAIGFAFFRVLRARLRRAPMARPRMLAGACICLALGVVVALVFPRFVSETPGSPASTVFVIVLWAIGATLILFGLPALIATLLSPGSNRDRAEN
jgi:hypothetical protein